MTPEPPEFHTKTLSPLSPVTVHPPEPENIPVLQNQIDPIFNMTSTHIEPQPSNPAVVESADSIVDPSARPDSPSADSSFSDAYKEEQAVPEGNKDEKVDLGDQGTEVSDDYAMTFDSDVEEHADSQDVSQANIEPETKSLPTTVSELPSSTFTHDPPTGVPQIGPDTHPAHTQPPPTYQTADASASNPLENHAAQSSVETTKPPTHTYEDIANGGIDIQQLLDNITANAEKNESTSAAAAPSAQASNTSLPKGSSGLSAHASLPPRPQIPQKRPYDDAQMYHAGPPGLPQSPSSFRPPGVAAPLIAAGAPGTSTDPRGGLPPPPSASFRPPPPSTASPISPASYSQINRSSGQDQLTKSIESREEADDIDQRWGPEIQKIYDKFLEDERMYVTEGMWDRFPIGSRLFIGNLPSEKVTKRDLFHVFHPYGKLAQVSIKQAYGFIQFHDSAACYEALRREQGAEVRGRKMHLEISKPQKNTRNAQSGGSTQVRRSRSPDYGRGGMPDRGGRQGRNSGVDRYDGRSAPNVRVDEYGRPLRSRDDYRPVRSPTPPRANFRGRDDYGPRGRDSYGRDRRRSRSRSPYGHRDNGRYRERSLSPRMREANEDTDLQIPRRDPRDVPDVQIILMEQLDRAFVSWVEGEMRARGVKTEAMFLSPRLPLEAVIRRQILEGVHAVSQLDMRSQSSSKIPLQVFDRQAGANNVRFDEYRDLDPKIAAELVLRSKQTVPQITAQPYAQPQFAPPSQSYQPPVPAQAPAPAATNLANLVGQLDNATLQKLLGTLNTPQQQNAPAAASNSAIDLAGLLGGLKQAPPAPQQPPQQSYQPQVNLYGNPAANPLASLLGNSAPQQPQQGQPEQSAQQVQNIMAQLARFRQ